MSHRAEIFSVADHVTSFDVLFFNTLKLDLRLLINHSNKYILLIQKVISQLLSFVYLDVLTSRCIENSLILGIVDRLNLELLLVRHESHPEIISDRSGFDFTEKELTLILEFIKNRDSQRSIRVSHGDGDLVELIEESVSTVPVASVRSQGSLDVLIEETINGNPFNRGDTDLGSQERFNAIVDEIVSILVPVDFVHLTDDADQMLDTKGFREMCVFLSLTTIETSFEFTLSGGNDECSTVSLAGTCDHIGHVVLVSWSIEKHETTVRKLEMRLTAFDGDTLASLFFVDIHDVSENPTLTVLFLRLDFELSDFSLIDFTAVLENTSGKSRLACIDVTDEYNIRGFTGCVNLDDIRTFHEFFRFDFLSFLQSDDLFVLVISNNCLRLLCIQLLL